MPGIYTFNSGSTVLQPVADALEVSVDKINFVVCALSAVPFAILLNNGYLKHANERVRQAYSLSIGLAYCIFCFGSAIKHLLANVFICYALLHFSPPKHVHRLVFIFAMSYLTWIHFARWLYLDEYLIDVTGPFMVMVQKVTTLAFSLHDGTVKKEEELTPLQKKEAINRPPSLLAYLSYMMHFQGILTGPVTFYNDWISYTRGHHIPVDKDGKMPSANPTAVYKMVQAFCFVAVIMYIEPHFPPSGLDRTDLSLPVWIVLFWFTIMLCRMQYYFAWYLADAIYNFSGFGFSGFDEQTGKATWTLATNVDAWGVETAQSFKLTLDSWNIGTMAWLRKVAYDRAPTKFRTIATYLLSAWWHGFFLGYYLMFLTGAIATPAGRTFRRCLRWRFVGNRAAKFFYDVFTFLGAKLNLAYITYPFVQLHWEPSIAMWKRVYFSGHLLMIAIITLLPLVAPPPKADRAKNGEEKKENGHAHERSDGAISEKEKKKEL